MRDSLRDRLAHIHRAGLFERDGLVYANDGDWVESLTALAETPDGRLHLLSHSGERLADLPDAATAAGEPDHGLLANAA